MKNSTKKSLVTFIKATIILLVIMLPTIYFGYKGNLGEMGLALVAGSIAAAFLNIDKFSRFKGAGFEAEMKKAVEEVYTTIDNIREIIHPFLVVTFNILTHDGKWDGIDPDTKHGLSKKLDKLIDSLDLQDKEIKDIQTEFNKALLSRYYDFFVGSLDPNTYNHNFKTKLFELHSSKSIYPSREDIERVFTEHDHSLKALNSNSNVILKKYLSLKKTILTQ